MKTQKREQGHLYNVLHQKQKENNVNAWESSK